SFHRELGQILWNQCGMARNEAGLKDAIEKVRALRTEYWENVRVPGTGESLNQQLEYAGRVADFMEFGELLALDALERRESCGGHFREESQHEDGEAKRNDAEFRHVAAWEFKGDDEAPVRNTEPLEFNEVQLSTRSYK
ncbi:MAG: fumarate reductase/succinate dehydrogenase flavoprotein subunit, partial [Planctomycetaceae bacterium]|nr:fumarate reductase/succinate dehydrogenase flavoprotein subunit [Planctomycetaceae bacterium]